MKYNAIIILGLSFINSCLADLCTDFNRAYELNKAGNILQSSQLYKLIINEHPECIQAIYNYAHTLKDLGQMPQAIEMYRKVIMAEPHNNFAHFGMSQCYLSQGDFSKGFALFDHRSTDIAQFKPYITHLKDLIQRNISLQGLKIIVRCEWGLGDCIQFIRYAQLLKNRGATIIVQAHSPLQKLFSLCPYLDTIICIGDAFPDHQLQIPLLSLPYIFDITIEKSTPYIPYIYADQKLVHHWKNALKADVHYKVGVCWQGNGNKNAPPLLNKNIPIEDLHPFFELKNVSIYSLQRIESQENKTLPTHLNVFVKDFDESHGRFMDTAALMMNLDLIITVDTSIAHLAGALGRPTWAILPHRTDWRWMLEREDSPFYPTVKLFRQPEAGDWKSVIENMCKELQKHLTQERKI